jgi:hypothetical protein
LRIANCESRIVTPALLDLLTPAADPT